MSRSPRRPARRRRPEALRLGPHGTGDQDGPIVAAWVLEDPLAELASLYRADTPEALQRVLVVPGRRAATNCWEAVSAFRNAHAHDAAGLTESMVLACTHRRWRKVARQLLDDLTDKGVLDSGVTGVLAVIFLHADTVAVTAPGTWLVDFYQQHRDGELHTLDPAETYTLSAPVSPQLRRWAARESVGQPDAIGPILARALRLDSQHGAAAILGLLDATDGLDPDTADDVLDIGLDWPSASVRLPALQRLAATGRHSEAHERAAADRAAHIRRWAVTHRQRTLPVDRDKTITDTTPDGDHPTAEPSPHHEPQPTLFG